MTLGIAATTLLGSLTFWWGIRFGRVLLRKGATANDLFKGKISVSLAVLVLYLGLIWMALYLPQLQSLPLTWRVYGMQVTWLILRITLLGVCGVTFIVSWQTARLQVVAVVLIGLLGLAGFNAAEDYFLQPIYPSLRDNLKPNGVFQQTSASSCAPSALATILRRWGLDATESSVARLAGTSRLGTSMPQLIVAAKALGMDGLELSPSWEQMRQINRPGVLATWLLGETGRQAHAVALIGMDRETAAIADPAFGRVYYVQRSQFDRIWRRQYVPIFRPTDRLLSPNQASKYLQQLGFMQASEDLISALRRFQQAMDVQTTGELDPETVLLLTGPFLEDVPTLREEVGG
jgi:predicted double-glycine peptidase